MFKNIKVNDFKVILLDKLSEYDDCEILSIGKVQGKAGEYENPYVIHLKDSSGNMKDIFIPSLYDMTLIVDALFVSEFCDGHEISVPCKVNTITNEVFDIESDSSAEYQDSPLEREYVLLYGDDFPVFQSSDITEEDNELWYE